MKGRSVMSLGSWWEERLVVQVEFGLAAGVSFERLRCWFDALEIEVPGAAELEGRDLPWQYLLFATRLSQGLLIAGNIPAFDNPEISALDSLGGSADRYRAVLSCPPVALVPAAVYQTVLAACFKYLALVSRADLTPENRDRIFGALSREVVNPLRRVIPSGKSTMQVLRTAYGQGIPFMHLGLGIFQLGWGSRARVIDRSTTALDSAIGSRLAHDKAATAALLKLAGLPHADHELVLDEAACGAAAERLGFPLVIKPCDQECGVGVSVDINDVQALNDGFKRAKAASKAGRVIVERQAAGVCHRIFIANGKLLYAVKRHPMMIHGDGVHSIAQIVADAAAVQAQRPSWCREVAPILDEEAIKVLDAQWFSPDTVPAFGEPVALRRIESTAWGGVDEEVTHRIHPENLAIALSAAALFKLSVAGVDMMSTDIAVPWFENGAIINEVNFAPLLGGAAISRSYIPRYLSEYVVDDGRIPVEFMASETALLLKYQELCDAGVRCFLVTETAVFDAALKPMAMTHKHLSQKIKALLMRSDVDAVLVWRGAGSVS